MAKKKQKQKKKKKKSLIDIIKDYAGAITIGMTLIAVIGNGIIDYSKKASSTAFYFEYLTIRIDDENWMKSYRKDNTFYYNKVLKSPTMNNKINQLLLKYPEKTVGYYVTYLIITQTDKTPATDVIIHFKESSNKAPLKNSTLEKLRISQKQKKEIKEKIEYPFLENEQLKIPISICKSIDTLIPYPNPKKCYYMKLKPVSIEYKNKYLFSKRKVSIREYKEHNVIVDGELVTGGKGSA